MEHKSIQYKLSSGSHEEQGRRPTMEDTHVHLDDVINLIDYTQNGFQHVAYYGVYDGHGGKEVADVIHEILHTKIFETDEFKAGDIAGALNKGFEVADGEAVKLANDNKWVSGTTGVVGMVADQKLYIGNLGDSEAILISVNGEETKSTNLTTPHKASDPSEKARIESMGGHVFFNRVFGALAVSRAFGDSRYKKPRTGNNFVSCEPAICTIELEHEHKYLILACDGLWDVCTHDEVAEITHKLFAKGKSCTEVAESLVGLAIGKRTEDNVSVIAVKIDWDGEETGEKHKGHDDEMVDDDASTTEVDEGSNEEKVKETNEEKVEADYGK